MLQEIQARGDFQSLPSFSFGGTCKGLLDTDRVRTVSATFERVASV